MILFFFCLTLWLISNVSHITLGQLCNRNKRKHFRLVNKRNKVILEIKFLVTTYSKQEFLGNGEKTKRCKSNLCSCQFRQEQIKLKQEHKFTDNFPFHVKTAPLLHVD